MALCHDTKSQFACRDKISPFLFLDMATGDQIVLLRFRALLQVNFTPLHYSVNVHWPYLRAQHSAASETQAFSTLLLTDPATDLPTSPFLSLVPSVSVEGMSGVCAYECTSVQLPGYQWVAL